MTHEELLNYMKNTIAIADDETAARAVELYPKWKPDIHANAGSRLTYDGILYRCLQSHDTQETWTPPVSPSLWAEVLIPDPSVIPDWRQPDSTNPYMTGDKVVHNGATWESMVDNNVWEPGAAGTEGLWVEI